MAGRLIAGAKQYDRGSSAAGKSHDLAKIEIECQHYTALGCGLLHNVSIRHPDEAKLTQMFHIMTRFAERTNRGDRHPHVREEFHAAVGVNGWYSSRAKAAAYTNAA